MRAPIEDCLKILRHPGDANVIAFSPDGLRHMRDRLSQIASLDPLLKEIREEMQEYATLHRMTFTIEEQMTAMAYVAMIRKLESEQRLLREPRNRHERRSARHGE